MDIAKVGAIFEHNTKTFTIFASRTLCQKIANTFSCVKLGPVPKLHKIRWTNKMKNCYLYKLVNLTTFCCSAKNKLEN